MIRRAPRPARFGHLLAPILAGAALLAATPSASTVAAGPWPTGRSHTTTTEPSLETPSTASAEGDVMSFGPGGGTVAGLAVHVLEFPELRAVTDADGHWRIEGIPLAVDVTFVLDGGALRYPIQTATFTDVDRNLDHVTFQSPSQDIVAAFEALIGEATDPDRCHIASTVTRRGFSLYGGAADGTHGEPGSTVTIEPAPARGGTPIYFNGSAYDVIWPDRTLTETTADGGVLFANVTPGTYTLRAHKDGAEIRPVTVTCRAGVLTNASPPWGLQVVSGGLDLDDTVAFPTPTTVPVPTTVPSTTGPSGPATTVARPAPSASPASPVRGSAAYAG